MIQGDLLRYIVTRDETQEYNFRDHLHRRVGTPAFHDSKDEITATRVAETKAQHIIGKTIFTTIKCRITITNLDIRVTLEINQYSAIDHNKI
jgi:hypothetical protein